MSSRRGCKAVCTICKKQCAIKTEFDAISSMHRVVYRTLPITKMEFLRE